MRKIRMKRRKKTKSSISLGFIENAVIETLEKGMEETASNMRSEVGNEFRAAYDYWKTQKSSSSPPNPNGRPNLPLLVLGDRPIPITRSRCWETLRENGDITNIANELMTAASNDEEKEDLEKELQSVFFQNDDDDDDDTIADE